MNKAQAAKEALGRMKSKGRFKLPEGDTTFRVLPNAKGLQYPDFVEYMVHFDVGPKHQTRRCGKSPKGEGKCWLCDVAIPKLSASKKESVRALATKYQPKEVMAVQIIHKDQSGSWHGPVLFETPGTVAQGLLGFFGRANRAYTDPNRGYNFTVTRTGTDKSTRYRALEPDDKPTKIPASVITKLKPFGELVQRYSEADIKAAYYGQDKEDVAEAIEEPEPADGAAEELEEVAALEATDEPEVEEVEAEVEEEVVEEEVAEEVVEEEVAEEETEPAEDDFNLDEPAAKPVKKAGKGKPAARSTEVDDIDFAEEPAGDDPVEEGAEEEVAEVGGDDDLGFEEFAAEEEEAAPAPKAKKPVAAPAKKPVAAPAKKPAPVAGKKPVAAPAKKAVKK